LWSRRSSTLWVPHSSASDAAEFDAFSLAIPHHPTDLQILEKSADHGKISSALTSCIQTTSAPLDKFLLLCILPYADPARPLLSPDDPMRAQSSPRPGRGEAPDNLPAAARTFRLLPYKCPAPISPLECAVARFPTTVHSKRLTKSAKSFRMRT